ncbi:hypothetical protein J1P26_07265 [Neobacillus sp. MM2021_6]|uniref:hypothetical protein n=1 Tax=Bacillaceae TaxID=186817 RepID=UPI00140CE613|nr:MULTISPECIES: hypothetical protein [Bacillaceae]MBO0959531.1 hypothetical protein [Neobacillus sp. MM2021_6]NHC17171.1 hypothetical protein [Bacillus sp. MM2020_4]
MKKFIVREVKEITREGEVVAETATQAILKFKNNGTDISVFSLSEESHITLTVNKESESHE